MVVRAKFKLTGVKKYEIGGSAGWATYDKRGKDLYDPKTGNYGVVKVADLSFSVVGHSSKPEDENNIYFGSTPSGGITLSVVNQEAVDELLQNIGKEFYRSTEPRRAESHKGCPGRVHRMTGTGTKPT